MAQGNILQLGFSLVDGVNNRRVLKTRIIRRYRPHYTSTATTATACDCGSGGGHDEAVEGCQSGMRPSTLHLLGHSQIDSVGRVN